MKWMKKICSLFKREKEREEVIILDACALKTHKAMEIMEQTSKVVLLLGTIKELDKEQKDSTELYIKNKSYILRKSREDNESKKYLCVLEYEKHPYVDDNIIEYCKDHQGTTILTCDNNLCSKAKAFHLPYIFCHDEQDEQKNILQESNEIEKKPIEETNNFILNKFEQDEETQLAGIHFYENFIKVYPIAGTKLYWKVGRNGKIINPRNYKVEDYIYICRYKMKGNYLEITIYQIIEVNNHFSVKELKNSEICYLNDIYKLNLPEDFENEIKEIYMEHHNC